MVDNFRLNHMDILDENEEAANKIVCATLFNLMLFLFVIWICAFFEVFDIPMRYMNVELGVLVPVLLINYGLAMFFKCKNKYLKYIHLTTLVMVVAYSDAMLTYSAALLSVLPVLVSCVYFSPRLTKQVSAAAIVTFFCSAVWGAYYGYVDYNMVILANDVHLAGGMEMADGITRADIDFQQTLQSAMRYMYLPRMMILILLTPLCVAISNRTHSLISNREKLTKENSQISTELNIAATIQVAMLPKMNPGFPDDNSFEISASMDTAKEVGGDFYDGFYVGENKFAMVIADVSGKGVPASLFMAVTKTLIKNTVQSGLSPAQAFNVVNRQLCDGNNTNMFVTAWLGLIDLKTGTMTYTNAGHNPPLFAAAGGEFKYFVDEPNLILGVIEEEEYDEYTLQLNPGDKVFLYTDGVNEAMDVNEEQYGTDRLKAFLDNQRGTASTMEIAQLIREDIAKFVNGNEQSDDITMLALLWKAVKANEE